MRLVFRNFINDFMDNIKGIKRKEIKKQIPNILTFSRALAPAVIIPTLLADRLDIVVVELIIFAITDFLDGRLARRYNCVSQFGVKLDAVCDKIFALGIMIPAIIKYKLLLINMILEICISYINLLSEAKNNHPKANMIGKIKTTLLSITLIISYIPTIDKIIILIASIITFMFQIMTFVRYKEIDIDKDKIKK
jgi:phosphatidylglycerophosphate synthase